MTLTSVANSFISTKEKLSTLADNYSELSWIKNKNSFGQKQVADIIRMLQTSLETKFRRKMPNLTNSLRFFRIFWRRTNKKLRLLRLFKEKQ